MHVMLLCILCMEMCVFETSCHVVSLAPYLWAMSGERKGHWNVGFTEHSTSFHASEEGVAVRAARCMFCVWLEEYYEVG